MWGIYGHIATQRVDFLFAKESLFFCNLMDVFACGKFIFLFNFAKKLHT